MITSQHNLSVAPETGNGACEHAPLVTGATSFKHYLWLFNRSKMFLREVVIESSAPLSSEELAERYDQMHDDLVEDVWPMKIGWIDWSSTPRDQLAA